jgi:serralysin
MSGRKNRILKVDVDVALPREWEPEAERAALRENAANIPQAQPGAPLELAVLKASKWQNGRTLRIRFMGGHPTVRRRVIETANEWTQYSNLSFVVVGDDEEAELRISFEADGSWSYVGTQALAIPQERATMNFGWLRPNSSQQTYSQVVLHEFGHAIGCVHEHSVAGVEIPWNKPAVYDWFETHQGWTRAEIDYNVFYRYEIGTTNHSEFDPHSIMIYPIPQAFTLGDFETPWSSRLSPVDKAWIATVYPK